MYIVALAWIYVVLMMSITEHSLVAGVMTFLMYGVVPVSIILYVMGTPQRRRKRVLAEKLRQQQAREQEQHQAQDQADIQADTQAGVQTAAQAVDQANVAAPAPSSILGSSNAARANPPA